MILVEEAHIRCLRHGDAGTAGARLKALLPALAVWLLLPVGIRAADQTATLQEVGHDDLGARGLNSALALADRCAYVGSRGQGSIAIAAVPAPAHPPPAGGLPGRAATTTRELRAASAQKLLAVLNYSLGRGGVNRLDFYHWSDDCERLASVGTYDFGGQAPHEFFLW